MLAANQRNLLWPVLVIATGLVLLLLAVDVLPASLGDLLRRAWPILLVIAGLNMLLMDRLKFGNWLALGLSLPLLGGIIYFAYDARENVVKTDYVESIAPIPLGEHIQGVNATLEILGATAYVRPMDGSLRALGATFTGSAESLVSLTAQENSAAIVDLSILERRREGLPNLADLGRGHLDVLLPHGVTVQNFNLKNESGGMRVDFHSLDVPRFRIESGFGDVDLYLPQAGIVIGDVVLRNGSLRLITDVNISLRVLDAPSRNDFDTNVYLFDSSRGIIESRGGLENFQHLITVNISNGGLTILTPAQAEEVP